MPDTFQFDKAYQAKVIRIMFQDFEFLKYVDSFLEPSNFESPALVWLFTVIISYYDTYKQTPTRAAIRNEFRTAQRRGTVIGGARLSKADFSEVDKLRRTLGIRVSDKQYVIDKVHSFIKHQAMKHAVIQSVDLLKKEDYATIEILWDDVKKIGLPYMEVGDRYLTDYKERVVRTMIGLEDVLPTGIPEVDNKIRGGGVCRKESWYWMGGPGVGKTTGLVWIAKQALFRGKNTAVITLEIDKDIWQERLDACISGVKISKNPDLAKLYARLESLRKEYGHGIYVRKMPANRTTVDDIVQYLEYLDKKEKFLADTVIIDYLELLRPKRRTKEKRFDLGECAVDIREKIACEMNMRVWSALQGNRDSLEKLDVTMKELSESIEPAKTTDGIVALCQTKEEKENFMMRLAFAKNRNEGGGTVSIATNPKLWMLYDPTLTVNRNFELPGWQESYYGYD